MGCGATKGGAAQPSAAPKAEREQPGEQPKGSATPKEADTTSLTFDESKIDKRTSNYVEESKLDIATVSLLKHKSNGSFVIMKKLTIEALEAENSDDILSHVSELTRLRHRHIVCYLWIDTSKTFLSVFIEYCEGNSLKHLIDEHQSDNNPFTEDEMRRYLRHMALGLGFLHDHNIIHRKMRPTNVMFSKDRQIAKIADYGEGAFLKSGNTLRKTRVGPELYMAPEMMTDTPYSFQIDIWALGIVLHEMATFKVPFPKVMTIPNQDNFEFVSWNEDQYSVGMRQLAKRILTVSVKDRPTSAVIVEEVGKLSSSQ